MSIFILLTDTNYGLVVHSVWDTWEKAEKCVELCPDKFEFGYEIDERILNKEE